MPAVHAHLAGAFAVTGAHARPTAPRDEAQQADVAAQAAAGRASATPVRGPRPADRAENGRDERDPRRDARGGGRADETRDPRTGDFVRLSGAAPALEASGQPPPAYAPTTLTYTARDALAALRPAPPTSTPPPEGAPPPPEGAPPPPEGAPPPPEGAPPPPEGAPPPPEGAPPPPEGAPDGAPQARGEADADPPGDVELTEEELQLVQELAARDREVRTHEQAHQSVGGRYAGSPSYEYESGPDGKRYAVGGEVPIDIGEAANPADTVRKMEVVRRAALAPAEPSGQDRAVAAQASQIAAQARAELQQQQVEEAEDAREAEDAEAEGAEATPADGEQAADEATAAEGEGTAGEATDAEAAPPGASPAPTAPTIPTDPPAAPTDVEPPASEAPPPPAPASTRTLDFAPRPLAATGTFLNRSATERP